VNWLDLCARWESAETDGGPADTSPGSSSSELCSSWGPSSIAMPDSSRGSTWLRVFVIRFIEVDVAAGIVALQEWEVAQERYCDVRGAPQHTKTSPPHQYKAVIKTPSKTKPPAIPPPPTHKTLSSTSPPFPTGGEWDQTPL
jgi:hypothetical protein